MRQPFPKQWITWKIVILISPSGRTLLSSTHSTNDNKWVTIGWKFISKYRGSNKGMEGIAAFLGIVSNVNRFSASARKQGNIQLAIVSLKWESEVNRKLHFFPTLIRSWNMMRFKKNQKTQYFDILVFYSPKNLCSCLITLRSRGRGRVWALRLTIIYIILYYPI